PRRADADVVADEHVARVEQLRQLREAPVGDRARAAIEDEQPARAAGPRLLCDPVGRKGVVEGVDAHAGEGYGTGGNESPRLARIHRPEEPARSLGLSELPRERTGGTGTAIFRCRGDDRMTASHRRSGLVLFLALAAGLCAGVVLSLSTAGL